MAVLPLIETSGDGSHTIISKEFDVAYHSHQGALEESMVIFIMAGLYQQILQEKQDIKVFEMAFGTGLNAFLSQIEADKNAVKVDYTGIELYPVDKKVYQELNYGDLVGTRGDFLRLHECEWNQSIDFSPFFKFKKIEVDILAYHFDRKYDIIYFDAFAPITQAFLWEEKLHKRLYNSLNPGGILVTYCAQGKFKRMLKSLGYIIEALPGPGRKHEMTRAIKVS